MMKQNLNKITKSKGFKLSMSILAAVVGIGAVSGLAVGLSMASESGYIEYAPYMKTDSKIDYGHDFNNNETQTSTYWAGTEDVVVGDKIEKKKLDEPTTATDLMKATAWSDPTSTNFNDRYNYTQLVSNGSGNAILDKSFQQAAYFAQTYWVHTADGVFNTNWNFEKPKFDFKFVKDLEISDTNQPDKE